MAKKTKLTAEERARLERHEQLVRPVIDRAAAELEKRERDRRDRERRESS